MSFSFSVIFEDLPKKFSFKVQDFFLSKHSVFLWKFYCVLFSLVVMLIPFFVVSFLIEFSLR